MGNLGWIRGEYSACPLPGGIQRWEFAWNRLHSRHWGDKVYKSFHRWSSCHKKWCSGGQSWDEPAPAHSRGRTTRGGAQRVEWGWSEEKRGQMEPALGAAALTRRLITRGNYNSPCLMNCLFPSLLTPYPASVSNVPVGGGERQERKQLTRPTVTPPPPPAHSSLDSNITLNWVKRKDAAWVGDRDSDMGMDLPFTKGVLFQPPKWPAEPWNLLESFVRRWRRWGGPVDWLGR